MVAEAYGFSVNGNALMELSERPVINYVLDSDFIPKYNFMLDTSPGIFNYILKSLGMPTIGDFSPLLDSLLSEVIVYYGDSIVHHKAAGIEFSAK